MAEVTRQGARGDLAKCPCELDARGPASDDHEREPFPPQRGFALALRRFESQQHAAADLERILNALETRCGLLPLVMTEVVAFAAGRDDQIIVPELLVVDEHRLPLDVDRASFSEKDRRVLLLPENATNRFGDRGRREARGRHLVEKRLEEVMVLPIDERQTNQRPGEGACCVEPGKTSPEDQDMRATVPQVPLSSRGRHPWQPSLRSQSPEGSCPAAGHPRRSSALPTTDLPRHNAPNS